MDFDYVNLNITNVTTAQQTLLFSPFNTIVVGVLCSLMAFMTISGNLLVILVFIIDRSLRKYSNYFILNLSIADLIIGFLIPMYTPFMLLNRNWIFGRTVCTIWLVFDYVVGCASVLCIVTISLDRYQLVSQGLSYVSKQKPKSALMKILIVWVIAFLVYGPAIILWRPLSGKSTVPEGDCQAEFHRSFGYLLVVACVEFFVPFLSICALNLAVYLNIRKRSKGLIRSRAKSVVLLENLLNNHLNVNNTANKTVSMETVASKVTMSTSKQMVNDKKENILNKTFTPHVNKTKLKKDRKAARSLFILVFLFVICWVGYKSSFLN